LTDGRIWTYSVAPPGGVQPSRIVATSERASLGEAPAAYRTKYILSDGSLASTQGFPNHGMGTNECDRSIVWPRPGVSAPSSISSLRAANDDPAIKVRSVGCMGVSEAGRPIHASLSSGRDEEALWVGASSHCTDTALDTRYYPPKLLQRSLGRIIRTAVDPACSWYYRHSAARVWPSFSGWRNTALDTPSRRYCEGSNTRVLVCFV